MVVRATWKYADPRLNMSHLGCTLVWHVQPRIVIFPCRTNYRPSSVKCRLHNGNNIIHNSIELARWRHVSVCWLHQPDVKNIAVPVAVAAAAGEAAASESRASRRDHCKLSTTELSCAYNTACLAHSANSTVTFLFRGMDQNNARNIVNIAQSIKWRINRNWRIAVVLPPTRKYSIGLTPVYYTKHYNKQL